MPVISKNWRLVWAATVPVLTDAKRKLAAIRLWALTPIVDGDLRATAFIYSPIINDIALVKSVA